MSDEPYRREIEGAAPEDEAAEMEECLRRIRAILLAEPAEDIKAILVVRMTRAGEIETLAAGDGADLLTLFEVAEENVYGAGK